MRVRDARQTFLGIWIRNLIQGKNIQVYGNGLQVRDFNFVSDVVDAILLSASSTASEGQVLNLGSKEVISLKALAEKLVALHGTGGYEVLPFPTERKAIDIGDYYSNFAKIQGLLGWSPKVSLDDGLALTLDYFVAHGDKYWGD